MKFSKHVVSHEALDKVELRGFPSNYNRFVYVKVIWKKTFIDMLQYQAISSRNTQIPILCLIEIINLLLSYWLLVDWRRINLRKSLQLDVYTGKTNLGFVASTCNPSVFIRVLFILSELSCIKIQLYRSKLLFSV